MELQYFISVSNIQSSKLGNAIADYIKQKYHHTVVPAARFDQVVGDIISIKQSFEFKYPREKPFRLEQWQGFDDPDDPSSPYIIVQDEQGKAVCFISTCIIRQQL